MVHESPETGWPYDKSHLGPPAGPRDAWAVEDGSEPHGCCWRLGCIPPRAPAIIVRTGLIMNYLPEIRQLFCKSPNRPLGLRPAYLLLLAPCAVESRAATERYRRAADVRWIDWWGRLEAGSFNTHCLAELCPKHCRGKRGCHSCDCHDHSQQSST